MSIAALALAALFAVTYDFKVPPPDHDYGPAPKDVEARARSYFEFKLKDSESARYRIGEPYQGYCTKGRMWGGKVEWAGWGVNVYVNSKNSYGGYVGFQSYTFLYSNGRLVRVDEGADFGVMGPGQIGLCRVLGPVLTPSSPLKPAPTAQEPKTSI